MPQQKKYKTILVDPPWDIDQRGNYGAINHYGLMSLERIKAMPVRDLADENAHCWLWVTNGTMRRGYEALEAWGFEAKGILTWIKPRFTLGNYLRNATEHLLFATKGKLPTEFHRQPSWFFAPLQEHSHKPEEQFPIIERMSPGPYLELFARRRQPGWDCWGLEAPVQSVTIPGYPVPNERLKGGSK
ncbi:MAG: cytosine methyltransferase [Oscillospiraceae bacterium]|nr:cytosine methyltransferase [Oscillospiraceae bacterium]